MPVGFEIPESSDDLEGVVDGLGAGTALSQWLPVFESGDDVFDAGSDSAVCAVVVTEDDTTIEQLRHGVAGHDDVVAVTGLMLRR